MAQMQVLSGTSIVCPTTGTLFSCHLYLKMDVRLTDILHHSHQIPFSEFGVNEKSTKLKYF